MSTESRMTNRSYKKFIFTTLLLLVMFGTGFYIGTVFQKNRMTSDVENQKKVAQVAATPIIGKVADISDKKISIKLTKNSGTKSYEMNSNTQILTNGKRSSATDIKKDQSVIILTEPGKPDVARRITISSLPAASNPDNKTN